MNDRLVIIREPQGRRQRFIWFIGKETYAVFYNRDKGRMPIDFLECPVTHYETKKDALRVSLRWMKERTHDPSRKGRGAAIMDSMGTVLLPYVKDGVEMYEDGGQHESRPAFNNAVLFTAERCTLHSVDIGRENVFPGGTDFKLFPSLNELKAQTGNVRVKKLIHSCKKDRSWILRYRPITDRQLLNLRMRYGPIIIKQGRDEGGKRVYRYSPALPVYGPYMGQLKKESTI